MIELSGDMYEGGGQILRTSLAMSARSGRAFRIVRIRAGRKKPGLQPQHLAAVRLAQALCAAEVRGATPGSAELVFVPGALQSGDFHADIGTAGSITLLLQAVVWAAAAAPGPCLFNLRGGSDVAWSPPMDYLQQVTLPMLTLADWETLSLRRGFYPKGGGQWLFRLQPRPLEGPWDLTVKPQNWELAGRVVASQGLAEARVAERIRQAVLEGSGVDAEVCYVDSLDRGVACCLWARGGAIRLGATALGERGKPAEQVGREAAHELMTRLQRPQPIEEHLADQLIPLLALRKGRMRCQEISPHCLANMAVVEAFLDCHFRRDGDLLEVV